jgi:hypothetical protein
VVYVVAGALIAATLGLVALRNSVSPAGKARRAFARAERTQVCQVESGPVRIAGRVRAHGPLLRAPVSQRPCVAFDFVAESESSEEDLRLREVGAFVVVDPSGEALVEPQGSFALDLAVDRAGGKGLLERRNDEEIGRLRALLDSAGISPSRLLGRDYSCRFREAILAVGDLVHVHGQARREVSPDGERRSERAPPEKVVIRGTAEQPVVIADDPGAGLLGLARRAIRAGLSKPPRIE